MQNTKLKSVNTLLALLLIVAMFLSSCSQKPQSAPDSGPIPTQTAEITPERTPYIPLTEKYSGLINEYTLKLPGYSTVSHDELSLSKQKGTARYTLDEESNTYIIEGTEPTGHAVLMFTGDLMCQGRQQTAALEKYGEYRFRESFRIVQDVFAQADFVAGNLESSLSESAPYMSEEKAVDDKPHCNAPYTYLDALRYAGFDALVTANNHCCDTGIQGILETHDHLNEYDFMHTGTFTPDDSRYILVEVNGIKLALMAYATYFNGKDAYITDEGKDIMLNRYSKERVEADVKAAKEDGAQFIIAYNHWGKEYTNEENEKQRQAAQDMANAGVDYIIGSHPHALQRYDIIEASDGRSVPCVYSMGNFVSHMTKTVAKDTIILRIELDLAPDGTVTVTDEGYIPCRVFESNYGSNYIVTPLSSEYNGGRTSKYFESALRRITSVMGDKIKCLGTYD